MRGHRDYGPLFYEASSKRGDFKELIMLMSEFDKTLKDSIESCARNVTYLFKTTQNDLLSCIKNFIQSSIVNDIQNQTEEPFLDYLQMKLLTRRTGSRWKLLCVMLKTVKP